ncbi:hypothetical protein [Tenacibaculum jejuense]|uniref:hypothetical protein n=1 Tax=Tenacibaculum jejuense TaxID=584609 RepID=UPI000BA47617|nr:hypothetical protein [Tenacibaculum jejuense]
MLKNIQSLGKSLTNTEQKEVKGGFSNPGGRTCRTNRDCYEGHPYLGPGDISCRYSFGGVKRCIFN